MTLREAYWNRTKNGFTTEAAFRDTILEFFGDMKKPANKNVAVDNTAPQTSEIIIRARINNEDILRFLSDLQSYSISSALESTDIVESKIIMNGVTELPFEINLY